MPTRSLPTVVDCQGCGVCCLHMGYPSFIQGTDDQPAEESWDALPENLRAELAVYIDTYPDIPAGQLDGPCVWFDLETRRCRHHDHRPQVCRDFELGGSDCLAWREVYRDRIIR